MPTVNLPGGPTIHYQEWGRPDGAVVLLLHGTTGSSDNWRNVGPALGHRFRVVAPDFRGHGASEWAEPYSIDELAEDVVRFMGALGVVAAIIVGHSTGGTVAYRIAATRPELVRLLVLVDMPAPDPRIPPLPLPMEPHPADTTDWRAVIAIRRFHNDPPAGWWELAERIPAKTLVIGASESHLDQSRLAEVARRIPHAEFVSIAGDHNFHFRRPSDLLRELEPFIAFFAK